jgi:hypothetical protein
MYACRYLSTLARTTCIRTDVCTLAHADHPARRALQYVVGETMLMYVDVCALIINYVCVLIISYVCVLIPLYASYAQRNIPGQVYVCIHTPALVHTVGITVCRCRGNSVLGPFGQMT